MAKSTVLLPYEYYPDPEVGRPISSGNIYVGEPDLDPEILANRKDLTVREEDGTEVNFPAASQPLNTGGGGVILYNGSPVTVLVEGAYSIKVTDSVDAQKYYSSNVTAGAPVTAESLPGDGIGAVVAIDPNLIAYDVANLSDSDRVYASGYRSPADEGDDVFYWDASSVEPDNGGTIIKATAAATGRFKRISQGIVNVAWFGVKGDGATDYTTEIQTAIDTAYALGLGVYFPPGTYRVTQTLKLRTNSTDIFTPGFYIIGAGVGNTIFQSECVSAPTFQADTSILLKFQLGGLFSGFTITHGASAAGTDGIYLRSCFQYTLENIRIFGLTGTGIHIPVVSGDSDGSNQIKLRQIRIEECAGWGIDAEAGVGFNELSFLDLEHVIVQQCGTDSADAFPPSGGMKWKGQIVRMENTGFALNKNCGLYIPQTAGLGQGVWLGSTTFENNEKRHLYCTGIQAFKARNIQLYSNDSFVATNGIEFDGSANVIRKIDIDGVVVRATAANNAYTAFKLSGTFVEFNSCRVRNVVWSNFDFAGQTRFNGWQFDQVENAAVLAVLASTQVSLRRAGFLGRGSSVPLRLSGAAGGVPSTSGEWIQHQVPSGGVSIGNSGLSANTRYYCYLYDQSGLVKLELSTTGFVTDGPTGYPVKSGDSTKYYVGSVETDGAAAFLTTAGGWLNPSITYNGPGVGAAVFVWADTTSTLRVKYGDAPTSNTDGTPI